MRLYYYKANRKIDKDVLLELLQKIHFYKDGHLVKVFAFKGALYLWSSTTITMTEVEKKFPGVFQPIESITYDGEELYTNH